MYLSSGICLMHVPAGGRSPARRCTRSAGAPAPAPRPWRCRRASRHERIRGASDVGSTCWQTLLPRSQLLGGVDIMDWCIGRWRSLQNSSSDKTFSQIEVKLRVSTQPTPHHWTVACIASSQDSNKKTQDCVLSALCHVVCGQHALASCKLLSGPHNEYILICTQRLFGWIWINHRRG
jgi:hypothetical protein